MGDCGLEEVRILFKIFRAVVLRCECSWLIVFVFIFTFLEVKGEYYILVRGVFGRWYFFRILRWV